MTAETEKRIEQEFCRRNWTQRGPCNCPLWPACNYSNDLSKTDEENEKLFEAGHLISGFLVRTGFFPLFPSGFSFLRSDGVETHSHIAVTAEDCRHVGCDLARSSTVFHRLAALGGALPYGTLSPCWCVKYTQNRTSFHDAHATSGTDGV